MIKSINTLEVVLKRIEAPVFELLQPGLKSAQIFETFTRLNFPVLQSLIDLYSWRNGIKNTDINRIGEMTLFSNGIFLPLNEAEDLYKFYAQENSYWSSNFFPLFSSGGGDFLLVDLNESSKSFQMIFLFSPVLLFSNTPMTIYDSLETLLLTVAECYHKKAYEFLDGLLETDADLEFEVGERYNPNSEYWRND